MYSDQEYREFAREKYHPITDIPGDWHPTIQRECVLMNEEVGQWMVLGLSRASAETIVTEPAGVTIEGAS